MMIEHTQNRPQVWLGWLAVLTCAALVSPINVHIVIAQEGAEIVVAPIDPGQPPVPPSAPELPSPNALAPELPAPEFSDPIIVEPPVPVAGQADAALSEVTNEAEINDLISEQADRNAVRTLSVEPGSRPILPADRPAWVGAAPDLTTAQHFLYVGSLPTLNESDSEEALDEPLLAAVRNYIDEEVIQQHGAANQLPIDAAFIRQNLIDDVEGYVCELTTSQGAMFQKWVTVRITPQQRELFQQWHIEASQRTRLAPLGLGLVSVLALISLSHLVLRGRHGSNALPLVNSLGVEPPVASRRSSKIVRAIGFFAFLALPVTLAAALVFTTLIPHHTVRTTSVRVANNHPLPRRHLGRSPDLHERIQRETLEDGHTLILQNTSRR